MQQPLLTFDKIRVGTTYADRQWIVSRETAMAYCRLTGAQPDAIPATLLSMWTPPRICFQGWRIPEGGIHASQAWQSYRLIAVGEPIRHRAVAEQTFLRKERPYVVFVSEFTDTSDLPVARGTMTILWPT